MKDKEVTTSHTSKCKSISLTRHQITIWMTEIDLTKISLLTTSKFEKSSIGKKWKSRTKRELKTISKEPFLLGIKMLKIKRKIHIKVMAKTLIKEQIQNRNELASLCNKLTTDSTEDKTLQLSKELAPVS